MRERALCFEESEGGEKKKGSFNDKQQENAQKSRLTLVGMYAAVSSTDVSDVLNLPVPVYVL